jgi:hypothetical protein
LLIEEQRTNSIRNNTGQGAVAGTPGTLPTNWTTIGLGTLVQEVVGTGTENGITYIDFRVSGTTSTTSLSVLFESNTQIVAASGQTWSASQYVKLVAGNTTNITAVRTGIRGNISGGATNESNLATFTPTSSLSRYTHTYTLANATSVFVNAILNCTFSSGVAIDITLRIGLPQLELGAFATSVIPTTTTALTRNADVASMTGTNFSSWYNQSSGSMFVEFSLSQPASGGNQFLVRASDNSYNNAVVDNVASTGFVQLVTASGGVFDGSASAAVAVSANTNTKFCGAYATNDIAACKDGGTVATDTSATIPIGLTRFDIGSDHAGLNRVKAGYIRRIAYYPVRVTNAQLQALTG